MRNSAANSCNDVNEISPILLYDIKRNVSEQPEKAVMSFGQGN